LARLGAASSRSAPAGSPEPRATLYWPLVGAGLGAAIAGAWWLASQVWPGGVAAGLAARHKVPLNAVGEDVLITTARRM